jgi:hypothetical protein
MSDTAVLRLAGVSGLLFLVLFIPSYLTPPDAPIATSTPQQVFEYFNGRQGEILLLNGVFLIFASFCFIVFMGVLHHAAQRAEAGGLGFSSIVLGGGLMFVSLMLVGAAAEIVHSATQARFQNFSVDAQLGFLSLAMSGWLYRFAFVGMSAMIAATSLIGLRGGLLPAWLAWLGFAAAVLALLRYFGPLGGWLCMAWIAAVCVLMIAGRFGRPARVPGG